MSDEKKIDPVAAALARAAEKNGTAKPKAAAKPSEKPVEKSEGVMRAEASKETASAESNATAEKVIADAKGILAAHDAAESSTAAADAPAKADVEPSVGPTPDAPEKPAEAVVASATDDGVTVARGPLVLEDTVKLQVPLTHREVLEAPHVPQIDGRGGYGGAGWGRKG